MKKIVVLITAVLFSALSFGQTAKQVLDKAAAAVSSKSGVTASFTMSSAQYGNTSGTISVKGRKFHASVPMATMWFDGKTQWTYMKKNNEVNVTTPTEAQLQAINPYNFINLYKQGYLEPFELPEPPIEEGESGVEKDVDMTHLDPMFEDAARLIVTSQSGSTSLIQRKYSIGYNRAGRLMDQLERAGIVGAAHGSKPREVLIQDEVSLENLLNSLR